MEQKEFYQFLLERYANGIASEDEIKELFAELDKRKDDASWGAMIENIILNTAKDERYDETYWQPVVQRILTTMPERAPVRSMSRRLWWAAAAVLLLAAVALYLFIPSGKEQSGQQTASSEMKEIKPGRQGAILTLADNSQVLLDTLKNGAVLALEGGANVRVVDGDLVYETKGSEIAFNTIATPKGRQYRVTLPDGTIVWLNSGSSVRYPTGFAGKVRAVQITGEAFLEVAKNAKMPFRVDLDNNSSIEVLGTSFNVNAYNDEPMVKTTLVDGSVNVHAGTQVQQLLPGQQAQLQTGQEIRVVNANIEQVIAWKNGLFDFNNKDVKAVLREIARWYDLDIIYEYEPATGEIVGKMQRCLALSQVMETLNDLDIHYRIEGRKLIISK